MSSKRHSAVEIVNRLRQADVELGTWEIGRRGLPGVGG